jgi:hypothetical protein
MATQPPTECLEIAAGRGRPGDLSERRGPREREVFHFRRQPDELGPDVALCAQDVSALRRRQCGRDRLEPIHLRERNQATDALRLTRPFRLRLVEVTMGSRGHHHVVPGFRRGNSALGTSPGHHGSAGGEAAFEDFVPADQPAAFGGEE